MKGGLVTAEQNKDDARKNERDPQWEGFKDYVKKMAAVPKEELDEKLAEEKREREEKRAG